MILFPDDGRIVSARSCRFSPTRLHKQGHATASRTSASQHQPYTLPGALVRCPGASTGLFKSCEEHTHQATASCASASGSHLSISHTLPARQGMADAEMWCPAVVPCPAHCPPASTGLFKSCVHQVVRGCEVRTRPPHLRGSPHFFGASFEGEHRASIRAGASA